MMNKFTFDHTANIAFCLKMGLIMSQCRSVFSKLPFECLKMSSFIDGIVPCLLFFLCKKNGG